MAEPPVSGTVLVTGGSGYLGSWVATGLLRRGYSVRATIRDLARQGDVRAMISEEVHPGDNLSFVAADLLKDDGWTEAVDGVDYVMHVASPLPVGEFRGHDVIRPAREGTRRVLEAAAAAGVRRVVLTSSTSAASPGDKRQLSDETVWTEAPDKPAYNYARAKTLAEQDAWAFAHKAGPRGPQLVTVLPSQIQGPVLGSDYSASVGVIALMLKGRMPAVPRVGFGIVDVRDLVDLHILAMTEPQAAGERFLATGEFLWFSDIAQILRERLGSRAAKAPTRTLPDWVIRLGALLSPEMAQMAPNLGLRTLASAAKAERLLGWRTRPAAQSVADAAESLLARGLI